MATQFTHFNRYSNSKPWCKRSSGPNSRSETKIPHLLRCFLKGDYIELPSVHAGGEVFLIHTWTDGTDHGKQQICSIVNCAKKNSNIEVFPVQEQPHSDDCGIFVFACDRLIVTGKKTTINAKFRTLKIKAQFLHCIAENNKLSKLPQWESPIRRWLPKIVSVMLFCSFV